MARPVPLRPAPRRAAAPRPRVPKAALDMLGRPGLSAVGGRIVDEWDAALQGTRGRKALREMADQDAIAGGILYAIEMLVRQVQWDIKAHDASPLAVAAAEFVDQALHDMEDTWAETLSEILSMLVYGWSFLELVYKARRGYTEVPETHSNYNDGRIGWRAWAIRSQESLDRWEFGPEGELAGMWQMPPPDYQMRFIPYEKALLFRPTVRRANPEGRSLLRSSYRNYYLKKHIETVEAIGIERDLVGFPVLRAPSGIVDPDPGDADNKKASDAYFTMLTNVRRDEQEGVMLPSERDEQGHYLYNLELLSSPGSKQFDTNTVIVRHNTAIAMSVLADFMMLGHNTRGANSLSVSKVGLFHTALAALVDGICGVINTRAIPKLLHMNAMDTTQAPTLVHGAIALPDLAAIGAFVQALAASGAQLDLSADSPLLSHLLEEANMPSVGKNDTAADVAALPTPVRLPDTPKVATPHAAAAATE